MNFWIADQPYVYLSIVIFFFRAVFQELTETVHYVKGFVHGSYNFSHIMVFICNPFFFGVLEIIGKLNWVQIIVCSIVSSVKKFHFKR